MGTEGEGVVGANCVLMKRFWGLVDWSVRLWVAGKWRAMELVTCEETRLKGIQ